MGVYRMEIQGRKAPLLVKADGVLEAKNRVITSCSSLNVDEMEKALTNGEKVWREGEPFPAEEAAEDEPKPETDAAVETDKEPKE